MTYPLPDAALDDDRLFFGGTAGAGKTYTAMGAVERLLARGARVVIPDPLSVWWGLRLAGDGRQPSGFDVVIFGGPHGDIPLTEHAAALIAELKRERLSQNAADWQMACLDSAIATLERVATVGLADG